MTRYLPIAAALLVVAGLVFWVVGNKHPSPLQMATNVSIGDVIPQRPCGRTPAFLRNLHIPQPVMIDLSQKRFTGIALLYGHNFQKALHPKQWEQYEHFSTYALDERGNIYLVPTPFISIRPTTFALQKNLYRLDSHTGKVSIFMELDDVTPSPNNPYGINAVAYDCTAKQLWVGAIDASDYREQKGVLYRIDPRTKKILQRYTGFDALTLAIVRTTRGRYLLAGSARDHGLYAFAMDEHGLISDPKKILEIPNPNEHIRKIKIAGKNRLHIETIPFSYSLIARSAKKDRTRYAATWDPKRRAWIVQKK